MVRAGRFVCVALPVLLTIAAIVAFLIATLSGVAHNSLYMFSVDLTDLSIDPSTVGKLADNLNIDLPFKRQDISEITAGDLGLGKSYDVTLWGYCENTQQGERKCTKAQYDWASQRIQKDFLDGFGSIASEKKIKLPEELTTALNVFSTVTRYTEIAFVVALAVLGLELFVGIFSSCNRVISCLTWLIGIAAIVLCVAAAGLATAMASIVVGAVEATAKVYGVQGSINTSFLACIWIGAGFSVAASLFWLLTICCCKPEHRSHNKGAKYAGPIDGEKGVPAGGYYPIRGDHEMTGGNTYSQQFKPSHGQDYTLAPAPSYYSSSDNNRSDLAYEPYSHRA